MLVDMLMKQGAKTDEEYREKLKRDIKLNTILGIVGLAAVIVGTTFLFRGDDMKSGFLCGLYAGTGFGIVVGGLTAIRKARKLLRNEKLLREERLKAIDERNRFIGMKAVSGAGIVTMVLCYLGLLISGFFNMAVMWTFWGILMFFSITLLILKKYLEKKL